MITRDELRTIMARLGVATVVVLAFLLVGALVEWIAHG